MKIGNARFCVSPKKEFYMIGYRSKNREYPAKGIHDDIYCNSLLFECNGKNVFLFSVDFLEIEEEMADEVKTILQEKYGIERDLVLLSATHNHSSIRSYHRSWYVGEFNQEYYDFIIKTIINSYKICLENMVEATAKYGKEVILGYYGNRNHPGKPADNEVVVVKFYDENNKPFAGIVNWAVHSTVISAENNQLTSELAGEVSKKLFNEFGFYPAMVVGAAGDCSNRNERQGNDFKELERVSTALSEKIGIIETNCDIELGDIKYQSIYHTVHHDMKKVHEVVNVSLEEAKTKYEVEADYDKKKMLSSRIDGYLDDSKINEFHLDAKFEVINIGKLQLFVFPGELGSKFGIKLKKECSTLGLIFGYTNGYYQYFMPEEEYGLSFETIGSPIPKGEPEKVINKFIQSSNYLNNCK